MWDYLLLFVFSTTTVYSTHSAMSMAHAHVLRESWKVWKDRVWKQVLGWNRGCAWYEYFVWWRGSIARLYDFVGITFFSHSILRRHDCFVSIAWSIIISYVNIDFYLESFRSEHSCHNEENYIEKLYWLAFHIKNSFFIIYLLEDEQELSMGMLDTTPTYL